MNENNPVLNDIQEKLKQMEERINELQELHDAIPPEKGPSPKLVPPGTNTNMSYGVNTQQRIDLQNQMLQLKKDTLFEINQMAAGLNETQRQEVLDATYKAVTSSKENQPAHDEITKSQKKMNEMLKEVRTKEKENDSISVNKNTAPSITKEETGPSKKMSYDFGFKTDLMMNQNDIEPEKKEAIEKTEITAEKETAVIDAPEKSATVLHEFAFQSDSLEASKEQSTKENKEVKQPEPERE